MTNTEAIETLRANYPDACFEQLREAVDTAIKALKSQDASGDVISRQAAINVVEEYLERYSKYIGTPEDNEMYAYARGLLITIEERIERLSAEVEPIKRQGNKFVFEYKPACPFHMTDCVCDPAYIRHYYPEWYERLYGNVPLEQAIQEFCAKRTDPFECYDDEDK